MFVFTFVYITHYTLYSHIKDVRTPVDPAGFSDDALAGDMPVFKIYPAF